MFKSTDIFFMLIQIIAFVKAFQSNCEKRLIFSMRRGVEFDTENNVKEKVKYK